jgi:hypothetical protein
MEGFCPVGRAIGSSIVRPGGEALGRIAWVFTLPHWSKRSESRKTVGIGMGTRLEQPGPEQGAGRSGPCSSLSGSSVKSVAEDEPPAMKESSRLKSSSRSEREETRWLQPAHAERGAQKPWNRSSISAPIPHRPSRSNRMDPITPFAIEPMNSRSLRPISQLFYRKCQFEKNVPPIANKIHGRGGALQEDWEKNKRPGGARTAIAPGLASSWSLIRNLRGQATVPDPDSLESVHGG